MLFYITQFLQTWLLPPGSNLLLMIFGFLTLWFWPRLGKVLITISFASLWLLSTPFVAQLLIDRLQYKYLPLSLSQLKEDKVSSIVVLEAGLNLQSPEYGMVPTVSESTLTRIRYSAFLYHKTKAPILVSGNDPSHASINQADYMANSLREYFGIPTKWKEDKGFNTAQEGIFSAEILKKSGIKKIYLVTSAYHMPRSVHAFKDKGLEIIPAPTGYISLEQPLGKIAYFFPNSGAMNVSFIALHEYIGLLWYRMYYFM